MMNRITTTNNRNCCSSLLLSLLLSLLFLARTSATALSAGVVDIEHNDRTLQTTSSSCIMNDLLLVTAPCISFTQFLQNSGMYPIGITEFTSRVVIPCGQCVEIRNDLSHINFVFRDGIDVQGKLLISCHSSSNTYNPISLYNTITIQSTAIIVQGQLHMDGTCKPIDSIPLIQISMIDKDSIGSNTTFVPIHSDVLSRCTNGICDIGQKSITVAGGAVTINGIPKSLALNQPLPMPTWVNLYDVIYDGSVSVSLPIGIVLKVSDIESIQSTWGVGSSILITSFTNKFNQFQQVRSIAKITTRLDSTNTNSGFIDIMLNQPITKPTTIVDDPQYAVEVALLSRNIVFTATKSGRDLTVGGHFWFFFTHNKEQQLVQGVDIQNFGQQGILGRYPVHVHHCYNTTSFIIQKNTVRQSLQRCIVVHGSNSVQVNENIAYDTFGHCFMLEDGIERYNVFSKNLGALTKVPKYIIPTTKEANNEEETDDRPSTFWISNPTNLFYDNVAAGSENTGFWFELRKRGIFATTGTNSAIVPRRDLLLLFSNNIAHSNNDKGMRTYPNGYRPDTVAKFTNLKMYRNTRQGIFFHVSSNIEVLDSIFADNGVGIDLDGTHSPAIHIGNVSIVGQTSNFYNAVSVPKYGTVCDRQRNIGIEMLSRLQRLGSTAYTFRDVTIMGFNHNTCPYSFPISVESERKMNGTMMFSSYSTMNTVKFPGSTKTSSIDYCRTIQYNVTDVYVTDIDGSLKPTSVQAPSSTLPATVVSLTSNMLQFVDKSKCTNVPSECLSYCTETCFRGIVFEVDPSFTEKFTLKLCSESDATNCIIQRGHRQTDSILLEDHSRYFPAYLPLGKYTAVFLDEYGFESFPSFADKLVTDVTCPMVDTHSVTLKEPPVSYSTCVELIRNGNMEMSSVTPTYWLAQGSSLGLMQLLPGGGILGTNALASVKSGRTIFIQYIDTRCLQLMIGVEYTLTAQIKLVDMSNGLPVQCNSATERCPEIGIFTETSGFQVGGSDFDDLGQLSSLFQFSNEYTINSKKNASDQYDDYIETMGNYTKVGSSIITPTNTNSGFQQVTGKFRITNELLQKNGIRFYIQSFKNRLIVDNVSMKVSNEVVKSPTSAPTISNTCTNMVSNSDMELGYSGYWTTSSTGDILSNVSPGYQSSKAIKYTKSSSFGPKLVTTDATKFKVSCLTSNTTKLVISAQVQLLRKILIGVGVVCDMRRSCPAIQVIIKDTKGKVLVNKSQRTYVGTKWYANAFNTFQASIALPTTPNWFTTISEISIQFGSYSSRFDLLVDNFSIQPL